MPDLSFFDGLSSVIFDMDGVLCDSEDLLAEAACAMFAQRFNVHPVPEDFAPFIGAGEDRYLGGVARQYGVEIQLPDDKNLVYDLYLQTIPGRLKALPGVLDFVASCETRGWTLAVATSADPVKMIGNLEEIKLPPARFKALITAQDVDQPKPHPGIFLSAAQKLGATPEDCLVVEDSLHGVKAGKAAGCRVLAVSNTFSHNQLQEAGADRVVEHLGHLL